MKRGKLLLPVLMVGVMAPGHAFTLDIASTEVSESGQGPPSIFVPGYGEVVFESTLDGALVLDSAYASTERIEVPSSSDAPGTEPWSDGAEAGGNPDAVNTSSRISPVSFPTRKPSTLHSPDAAIQNPAGDWNAVPEAASAMLGLVGTLMLLLRRRLKTTPAGSDKP